MQKSHCGVEASEYYDETTCVTLQKVCYYVKDRCVGLSELIILIYMTCLW